MSGAVMLFHSHVTTRILIQNDGSDIYGSGMQIQLLMDGLRELGLSVDYSNDPDIDLRPYSVVHLNHLRQEWTAKQYLNCLAQKTPYTVKCIWVSGRAHSQKDLPTIRDIAKNAFALTYEAKCNEQRLINLTGNKSKLFYMLPAIHPTFRNEKPLEERKLVHINGRYSRIKGHLEVIKACKELQVPVVTAGWITDEAYYQTCRNEEYGDVKSRLDHEALNSILNDTRVYVCASQYELAATSVGEALECGCLCLASTGYAAGPDFNLPTYEYGNQKDLVAKLKTIYESDRSPTVRMWSVRRLAVEYLRIWVKAAPELNWALQDVDG